METVNLRKKCVETSKFQEVREKDDFSPAAMRVRKGQSCNKVPDLRGLKLKYLSQEEYLYIDFVATKPRFKGIET